mmetsp:Transcript_31611/g.82495  ORF Transcript_31611/g.82495 Transcript_31611/m.82495 type:complete len:329 (-) Transcript_31611:2333-3319(-)
MSYYIHAHGTQEWTGGDSLTTVPRHPAHEATASLYSSTSLHKHSRPSVFLQVITMTSMSSRSTTGLTTGTRCMAGCDALPITSLPSCTCLGRTAREGRGNRISSPSLLHTWATPPSRDTLSSVSTPLSCTLSPSIFISAIISRNWARSIITIAASFFQLDINPSPGTSSMSNGIHRHWPSPKPQSTFLSSRSKSTTSHVSPPYLYTSTSTSSSSSARASSPSWMGDCVTTSVAPSFSLHPRISMSRLFTSFTILSDELVSSSLLAAMLSSPPGTLSTQSYKSWLKSTAAALSQNCGRDASAVLGRGSSHKIRKFSTSIFFTTTSFPAI